MRKIAVLGLFVFIFLSLFTPVLAQNRNMYAVTPKTSPVEELQAMPPLDATPFENPNELEFETQEVGVQTREEIKAEMQAKLKARQQAMVQARAELKTRLHLIKDSKKQEIVEKINERLMALNKLLVEKLTGHLDRLQAMLDQLEERASEWELSGQNVSSIRTQIVAIRKRMAEFRARLDAQGEKNHTPQITTEANLRLNVGASHQALQTDLKALREELLEIKEQVLLVAKLLIELKTPLSVTPTP